MEEAWGHFSGLKHRKGWSSFSASWQAPTTSCYALLLKWVSLSQAERCLWEGVAPATSWPLAAPSSALPSASEALCVSSSGLEMRTALPSMLTTGRLYFLATPAVKFSFSYLVCPLHWEIGKRSVSESELSHALTWAKQFLTLWAGLSEVLPFALTCQVWIASWKPRISWNSMSCHWLNGVYERFGHWVRFSAGLSAQSSLFDDCVDLVLFHRKSQSKSAIKQKMLLAWYWLVERLGHVWHWVPTAIVTWDAHMLYQAWQAVLTAGKHCVNWIFK